MSLRSILEKFRSHHPPRYMILLLIVVGYIGWHFTQHLILLKGVPTCGISDRLQNWTFAINQYAHNHPTFANASLIITSFWVDLSCFILFAIALVKKNSRPLLTLGFFLFCRQVLQYIVSLPLPADIIWHNPGFPSIMVAYYVSNDLYFSAHTGISLIAAMEISLLGKKIFSLFAYFMLLLQVLFMISFQVHYTMDIYTAIITAIVVHWVAKKVSPSVDFALWKIGSWRK